jgi:hypothetical protein
MKRRSIGYVCVLHVADFETYAPSPPEFFCSEEILFAKKNADINNKSENWKNSLFFCPVLIDAECDFIGQLNRR